MLNIIVKSEVSMSYIEKVANPHSHRAGSGIMFTDMVYLPIEKKMSYHSAPFIP